jgi:uncharacterized protein (TIGR02611 family)
MTTSPDSNGDDDQTTQNHDVSHDVGHDVGHDVSPDFTSDDDLNVAGPTNDWEWRRKIRATPQVHLIYRIVIGVVGLLVFVLGLILVPFPGPGWLVVLLGIGIWASEFTWAQAVLHRARRFLRTWTDWARPQPWWVKGLLGLLTAAAVAAVFWLMFRVSGIPSFFPDFAHEWLKKVPGLGAVRT